MPARLGPRIAAAVLAGGMVILGLCAAGENLWLGRWVGGAMAASAVAYGLAADRNILGTLALSRRPRRWGLWLGVALALGIAWGLTHRWQTGEPTVPGPFTAFCLAAVAIGVCEEVLFRGFFLGWVRGRGRWMPILLAAAAHTAYKCSIFLLPHGSDRANLPVLAAVTLVGGLVLGLLRERLGNLAYPIIAHATFDAVAYGDLATAPWWVW
jgi:membrane protease YdiL (CAAX protease family)